MLKMKDILDEKDKRLRLVSKDVEFPLSEKEKKTIEEMIEFLRNSQIPELSEKYDLRPGMGLSGYDIEGRKIHVRAREELAICFQHEMDHLNGILFMDHIDKKNPFKDKDIYRAI